ncbi:MAG TPA: hypothetical protein VNS29_14120 [Burkholderiaceae bacterium]|nr:hypothetical protein [Burkholderiaceae bacterium]
MPFFGLPWRHTAVVLLGQSRRASAGAELVAVVFTQIASLLVIEVDVDRDRATAIAMVCMIVACPGTPAVRLARAIRPVGRFAGRALRLPFSLALFAMGVAVAFALALAFARAAAGPGMGGLVRQRGLDG